MPPLPLERKSLTYSPDLLVCSLPRRPVRHPRRSHYLTASYHIIVAQHHLIPSSHIILNGITSSSHSLFKRASQPQFKAPSHSLISHHPLTKGFPASSHLNTSQHPLKASRHHLTASSHSITSQHPQKSIIASSFSTISLPHLTAYSASHHSIIVKHPLRASPPHLTSSSNGITATSHSTL